MSKSKTKPTLRPSSAQFFHPDTKEEIRFRKSAVDRVETATADEKAQSVYQIAKKAEVSVLTARNMLYVVPSLRALVAAGHVGRSENGVTPKLGSLHPSGDLPIYKSAGTELAVVIDTDAFADEVIGDDLRERIATVERFLSRTNWSPKKRQKELDEFIDMEMHAAERESDRANEVNTLEDKLTRLDAKLDRAEAILDRFTAMQAPVTGAVAVHKRRPAESVTEATA